VRGIKRMNNRVFVWLFCFIIAYAVLSCSGLAFAAGLEVSVQGGNWNIGTLPPNGTAQRLTCSGYLDSAGNCWFLGSSSATCDATCSTHGGCYAADWNDNTSCTICMNQYGGTNCGGSSTGARPSKDGSSCYYRIAGNAQHCDYYTGSSQRLCVCQEGPWKVTGSSDGTEDIDIKVSSTGAWYPSSATSSVNQFVLKIDNASGMYVDTTIKRLKDDLTQAQTYSFGLWFQAPITGSESGNHTLTVTLIARNYVGPCGGYKDSNGLCWYQGNTAESCDTACATHGGCNIGNWNDNTSCTVCHYFQGGTCVSQANTFVPHYYIGGECRYRSGANQACSVGYVNMKRQCVCNTGSVPSYSYGGYVWYKGEVGQTCNTVCSAHGASCVSGDWNDDASCTVCTYLFSDKAGCNSIYGDSTNPAISSVNWNCYTRASGYSQDCAASVSYMIRFCACTW
jgi:hypothetical protein